MHKIYQVRHIYLFLIIGIGSCLSQDEMVYYTSDELTMLLASDSVKSWNLVGRYVNNKPVLVECELDDTLTYTRSTTTLDTARVKLSTGPNICTGQSQGIVFKGYWTALESTNAQTLQYVIEGDTSLRSVDFISSQQLQISYQDGNDLVLEEFVFLP